MSSFPGSPRLVRGALISYEPAGIIPQVVIFQYNPETLTRTLKAQRSTDKSTEVRLTGPPVEDITLKMEIDAADQLEKPGNNATTVALGINPQLARAGDDALPKEPDCDKEYRPCTGRSNRGFKRRTAYPFYMGPKQGASSKDNELFNNRAAVRPNPQSDSDRGVPHARGLDVTRTLKPHT